MTITETPQAEAPSAFPIVHPLREQWLDQAISDLRNLFESNGFTLPEKIRVSVGFPHGSRKAIGQCWHPSNSSDAVPQIFISPILDNSIIVLATLTHELVHVLMHAQGNMGHGREFKAVATKLGLEGKMTATHAGKGLTDYLMIVAALLGKYPHGSLSTMDTERKKQTTRMLKMTCPQSGYIARTTSKWLAEYGPTLCPCHNQEMELA